MLNVSTGDEPRPLRSRDGDDRRMQDDRRKSSVDMRLRVGLWYQYHRATRSGEFDLLPRNEYKRLKLQEALMPEMQKYEFWQREKNSTIAPAAALSNALDFLWSNPDHGRNAAHEPIAVYTVSAIAEYLARVFRVTVIDRRKMNRRSTTA